MCLPFNPIASVVSIFITALLLLPGSSEASQSYDILLRGGTVVDGSAAPGYRADVAILDGRVAAIGDLAMAHARRELDVSGKVVAPGFIDVHSHADRALKQPETASIEGFLRQGVTTAVYGVDGFVGLDQLKSYAQLASEGGSGINFMSYIGHNAVRSRIMGNSPGAPTEEQLDAMKALVDEAMRFGAIGLSTGLMYLPGSFSSTEEVIELAAVTAPYGGLYDSHVRDPANNLLASHREALDIALAAGVDAHPGHVKAVGASNFGKGPALVELMREGLDRGQNVTIDLYPYDGAATAPVMLLLYPGTEPRGEALLQRALAILGGADVDDAALDALAADLQAYWRDVANDPQIIAQARARTEDPPGGLYSWINVVGYESMRIVDSADANNVGRMVTDLAAERGVDPFELYRQLIVEEGRTAMVTLGAIQEEDIRILMRQPWAMISSDGEELKPMHPRGRGTFARLLGRYVREWGVLTLEDAVHKISGLPAKYLKLADRGILRAGSIADIAVFDPASIIDRSTWSDPGRYAEGVEYVFIAGNLALDGGQVTGRLYGQFVRFSGDYLNQ
jgi:N-acyl-D-aspartate/D-glutamate deacylase